MHLGRDRVFVMLLFVLVQCDCIFVYVYVYACACVCVSACVSVMFARRGAPSDVYNARPEWFWPKHDSSTNGQLCWTEATLIQELICLIVSRTVWSRCVCIVMRVCALYVCVCVCVCANIRVCSYKCVCVRVCVSQTYMCVCVCDVVYMCV